MTDRKQWLLDRQSGIGASDAPCIVGVGYKSARDIYRAKVDPIDERPPTGQLQRGIVLEPIVAQMYADTMGVELLPGRLYRHPERVWQLASLDYTRQDNRDLECKTVGFFNDEWGESGSDIIPEAYRVQTQHQMGVRGTQSCDLAALSVVTWELRIYRLEFDPNYYLWLTSIEAAFWAHVKERLPPDGSFDEFVEDFLVSNRTDGALDLGSDVAAMIEERQAIRDVRKEAQRAEESLTNEIKLALGATQKATAGTWALKQTRIPEAEVSYTREAYTRLDIRAIKPGRAKRMYALPDATPEEIEARSDCDPLSMEVL